jgi:hypothetical protein
MEKKEILRVEVSKIWKIFIICKECFDYSYYLYKPETKEEFDYLQKSRDFEFIRQIMWRMSIIELSKLFSSSSKRDRYNLYHLINRFKEPGNYSDISVDKTTLGLWESQLSKNQIVIDKILTLRDKLYAHTDSDSETFRAMSISFEEVKGLLQIIEDVIKQIYQQVFESEAMVENLFFEKTRFKVIKILCEEEKRKLSEWNRTLNENKI